MKKNYAIRIISSILTLLIIGGSLTTNGEINPPQNVTINTNHRIVGRVNYKDFIIEAEKIISDIGIGYCLEIDKDYPSGQVFEFEMVAVPQLNKILAHGFPYLSASELGLNNDEDAYFATQVALWSVYEGYDVHKFYGASPRILSAIINIYENANNPMRGNPLTNSMEYYLNDTTQRVVLYVEDIAETPQPPSGK